MDIRYAAKFVQNNIFNQVKGELNTLQDEVANMNPFTDEDKETLDKLAAADRELFNHQDVFANVLVVFYLRLLAKLLDMKLKGQLK